MSNIPKLTVKWLAQANRDVLMDLQQAKFALPFSSPTTISISIEGEQVKSYEELVRVAEKHKDKSLLEVTVFAPIAGG